MNNCPDCTLLNASLTRMQEESNALLEKYRKVKRELNSIKVDQFDVTQESPAIVARSIVSGLTNPNSGWYNSPDDLEQLIEAQLFNFYGYGKREALKRIKLGKE